MLDTWQRYRDTLDSLLEGFQIIGRDWTYLYVNPVAAGHGGHTPEELRGRKMCDVYPGIEQTPLFATLTRCMIDGEVASFENLFTFPDQTTRWFEIRVQPVPEGVCVHSVDIQRRKEAEASLRERESVAAMGEMAAVVAHEVRNPLTGLSGALQVLKGRRAAGDPEIPVFNEMLACIQSLTQLIEDLLVFAKPIQVATEPVSIADVVRDALVFLDTDESLRRHAVSLSVEDPPPIVPADRELLKNVFRNLFLNAAQAMPETGTIDVHIGRAGSACRVTVADTGPGIQPALSARIFEPLVTSKPGGTGLGLPISRRILRLHGGELELLHTGAPGATFLVSIPLHS
jgi:PAS domain S-box-containing protein